MDPLDELAAIHARLRWHKCVDGYQWRIMQRDDGQYVGELVGPGKALLNKVTHLSRSRVEGIIIGNLYRHRSNV